MSQNPSSNPSTRPVLSKKAVENFSSSELSFDEASIVINRRSMPTSMSNEIFRGDVTTDSLPGMLEELSSLFETLSVSEILLNTPSSGIYHVGTQSPDSDSSRGECREFLLAANYHDTGMAEAQSKIVVQDLSDSSGHYVLWTPDSETSNEFFKEDLHRWSSNSTPELAPTVINPLKVENMFYHFGNPNQIMYELKEAGYTFHADRRSDSEHRRLTLLKYSKSEE